MSKRQYIRLVHSRSRIPNNQVGLFDELPIKGSLETIAQQAQTPEVLNDKPAYGIVKEVLAVFMQRIRIGRMMVDSIENGLLLEKILEGIINFESLDGKYGVPHEILARMNTPEILALYAGIQQRKVDAMISTSKERYDGLISLIEKDFSAGISELVGIGYTYPIIVNMANHPSQASQKYGFHLHPHAPEQLIERMRMISPEAKRKFIDSLKVPYRRLEKLDQPPSTYFSYPAKDPFSWDEERHDNTGKKRWITDITNLMRKVYDLNTPNTRRIS